MSHLYTHFVHIHYDTILPMPPGRDLLSLPLTATSGTAKLQAGPIGSMQGFDRQLLLNTRQSVGWTLRRPVRLHGRYPGNLGADPDEAQAATTTLRIYCYRLHINQLRLFQYWTRLGRCREGVMNDVLCGSIWLILVRAFWEYFMFLAIAKVGNLPIPHTGQPSATSSVTWRSLQTHGWTGAKMVAPSPTGRLSSSLLFPSPTNTSTPVSGMTSCGVHWLFWTLEQAGYGTNGTVM